MALLQIKAATDATSLFVQATTAAVQSNTSAVTADTSITSGKFDSSIAVLNAMKALQDTSASQLSILRAETARVSAISFTGINPNTGGQVTLGVGNDTLIDQLKKIVANTYAIAFNTSGAPYKLTGVYAEGGWITGGIPGRDSVPIMAMPDEYMVNADATRALTSQFGAGIMDEINAGRLPERTNIVPFRASPAMTERHSENGETIQELKELKKLLGRLIEGLGNDSMIRQRQNNQNTSRVVEAIEEVIGDGAKRIESQMRMSARSQR